MALQAAVIDDRFWITPIVRMEILYSARGLSEYMALETELDAVRILRNDRAVTDAAMAAFRELAQHRDGYHRVPLDRRADRRSRRRARRAGCASSRRPLRPTRRGARVRKRRTPRYLSS